MCSASFGFKGVVEVRAFKNWLGQSSLVKYLYVESAARAAFEKEVAASTGDDQVSSLIGCIPIPVADLQPGTKVEVEVEFCFQPPMVAELTEIRIQQC